MALEIIVETKNSSSLIKVWITCPKCKHKEWYYGFWARRCTACSFVFGNTKSISEDIDARLGFHKNKFKG